MLDLQFTCPLVRVSDCPSLLSARRPILGLSFASHSRDLVQYPLNHVVQLQELTIATSSLGAEEHQRADRECTTEHRSRGMAVSQDFEDKPADTCAALRRLVLLPREFVEPQKP